MKVLTCAQIKYVEKMAADNGRFSYEDMMEKAGAAVFYEISKRVDIDAKRILLITGPGNNGGDAIVAADLLRNAGADVELYFPLGAPSAQTAKNVYNSINTLPVCNEIIDQYDIYIDALFGIGFNRGLTPEIITLLEKINAKQGFKVAIDLPSGVYCDGGMAEIAFRADITVTFIGYKLCHLLPPTASFCGEVILNNLGIEIMKNFSYEIIDKPDIVVPDSNSHKGTFGTALLFCGSYGMCGAQILSARAAITSGAGIVKCIVCDKNYAAFTQAVPEAVTIPVETSSDGAPLLNDNIIITALNGSSALLIGCGIGRTKEAKSITRKMLQLSEIPVVLDADGINAIDDDINILRSVKAPLILTPHPGEMGRLLGVETYKIESNRIYYAKEFSIKYKCVLVLKGANTIVAAPNGELFFNITGNYGMGKGGSGDVLSGIITALLANGCDAVKAAKTAVYVHGRAGDNAAERYTKRTMLPSDIIRELKHIEF
ncbi:MAG: NAD(P)H-hydrate dehydratase [Clostridia bacterium]|nr:NAD(P)H-hydrate dehydratase [Clostridia bacterium]